MAIGVECVFFPLSNALMFQVVLYQLKDYVMIRPFILRCSA